MQDDFRSFYLANFGDTVTLSYAYTADLAEAQDIAQEAFSRAWIRWRALARYDNPAAWVRRVAYNLAHSRWRRVKTAAAHLVRQRLETAPELNPDHVALVEALRKLPRQQREAIVWHHIADLPVEDVAHQLQVPIGTVKTWLQRGRSAMAKELGIDVRQHMTTPPATEAIDLARKRARRRVSTTVGAVVVMVLLVLAAAQFLRPKPPAPPVTPSPSPTQPSTVDEHDPMRSVDWSHATIRLGGTPGCPLGAVTFKPTGQDSANGQLGDLSATLSTRVIALGDLTGDGRAEAVLMLDCSRQDLGTARRLALIQLQDGELVQIGAADPQSHRVWTFWLEDGLLHMDGSSFAGEPIGSVYSWKWDGSAFAPYDSSKLFPPIGHLDLTPVADKLACQSLPAPTEAQLRLNFGNDLVITTGDRTWDFNRSHTHPKFEERGRIGNPYLVLSVDCAPVGTQQWSRQTVTFDRVDGQWQAVAVSADAPGIR